MYERTVAKKFNIENTYGIIFFGCLELDLMN